MNDTTPPVFQSLSVSPTTVAAGSNFTATTRITDDLSGVSNGCCNSISLQFSGPSAQSIGAQFTRVSGTAQDGVYQAFITVPAAYPSGTYYVSYLIAYDAANNRTQVNYPAPPTTNGTITVTGGVNDTTPPIFQSLSVSPTSVAAGSNFTATAHITDDISGVTNGCCILDLLSVLRPFCSVHRCPVHPYLGHGAGWHLPSVYHCSCRIPVGDLLRLVPNRV